MFNIDQLKKDYMTKILAGLLTSKQAQRMLRRAAELNAMHLKRNKKVDKQDILPYNTSISNKAYAYKR